MLQLARDRASSAALMTPWPALLTATGDEEEGEEGITLTPMPPHCRQVVGPAFLHSEFCLMGGKAVPIEKEMNKTPFIGFL